MLRPSPTPNISEQRQRNTFMDHNLHLFLGKAVNTKLLSVVLSSLLWCLLDHGVSGVRDDVSLSANEGHSITLHTGVKTDQQEKIRWYFSGIRIAEITGDFSFICTDVQCKDADGRFRNRLKLDHQTGSLTIKDTRTRDSGVYKLKIMKDRRDSEKIFIVFVHVPGLSAGEIAGICAAAVLLLMAASVCVFYFYKRRVKRKDTRTQYNDQAIGVNDLSPNQSEIPLMSDANERSSNHTDALVMNTTNDPSSNHIEMEPAAASEI